MEGRSVFGRFLLLLALVCIVPALGCMGAPAQLMYILYGQKISAEYEGLEGKRVAVVCVSDASSFGPNTLTYPIERGIAMHLQQNVKDISIIPQSAVEEWKDDLGWDEADFVEIGRGLNADKVVAIEISGYSLHDGVTMYKGRANVDTTVYDIGTELPDYHLGTETFEYPTAGHPSIQTSDRQFESAFLTKLTNHLARRFYDYEKTDAIADDATSMYD